MDFDSKWIVALTGASGMRYGIRLVSELAHRVGEVHVIVSEAAHRVLKDEENIKVSATNLSAKTLLGEERRNITFHNPRDIGSAIASGSYRVKGMVIVPCSMSTLGAISHGVPQNLVHRAAEVTIKEGRPLILVPRETPLSTIHIENMLRLSKLGVRMVPAMPGYYHQPQSIEDIVDMLVMKILDQMGIENNLVQRWGEPEAPEDIEDKNQISWLDQVDLKKVG